LTIHTASQSPSSYALRCALLGLAGKQGAGEGAPSPAVASAQNSTSKLEALVAALTLLVQRPVKISLTMEDSSTRSPSMPPHSVSRAA